MRKTIYMNSGKEIDMSSCKHETYTVLETTHAGHGVILDECICETCKEYFTKDSEGETE
jgi:hypothetical protein